MPAPTEGPATTYDRIQLNWHELTTTEETGATYSILSYHLQISYLPDTWLDVVGGDANLFTQTTYTESNLVTGQDYKFRIRASNSFGWGEYSSEVTIRADEVPA